MSARGAYNTRQRAEIHSYLSEHKRQRLSVEQLTEGLLQRGVKVGKTTVYRYLEALSNKGAARKYVNAEGATCYQYIEDASDCARHAHLVCTECGELLHLECELMRSLSGHMHSEHGFVLDEQRTVLYGRCGHCAAQKE